MTELETKLYVLTDIGGAHISDMTALIDAWLTEAFKKTIDNLSDTDKAVLRGNRDVNNPLYSNLPIVRVVCGKRLSIHTIVKTLEMGFSIEVVCGNHLVHNVVKTALISLKTKCGGKFKLYVYGYGIADRMYPQGVSTNVGRNLLYEDERAHETAFVVENVSNEMVQDYIRRFDELKSNSKELTTIAEIGAIPILTPYYH